VISLYPLPKGSSARGTIFNANTRESHTIRYYDCHSRMRSLLPLPVPSAIADGNANANTDASTNAHFKTELYTVGDGDADADTDGDAHTHSDSHTSEYANPAASRVESDSGIVGGRYEASASGRRFRFS
jgi:hypothetical protein